jgi:hypothetical protein
MHPMASWETSLRPSALQPAHKSDCSILIAVSLALATANNQPPKTMKTAKPQIGCIHAGEYRRFEVCRNYFLRAREVAN